MHWRGKKNSFTSLTLSLLQRAQLSANRYPLSWNSFHKGKSEQSEWRTWLPQICRTPLKSHLFLAPPESSGAQHSRLAVAGKRVGYWKQLGLLELNKGLCILLSTSGTPSEGSLGHLNRGAFQLTHQRLQCSMSPGAPPRLASREHTWDVKLRVFGQSMSSQPTHVTWDC